jgi:hypothetical protein
MVDTRSAYAELLNESSYHLDRKHLEIASSKKENIDYRVVSCPQGMYPTRYMEYGCRLTTSQQTSCTLPRLIAVLLGERDFFNTCRCHCSARPWGYHQSNNYHYSQETSLPYAVFRDRPGFEQQIPCRIFRAPLLADRHAASMNRQSAIFSSRRDPLAITCFRNTSTDISECISYARLEHNTVPIPPVAAWATRHCFHGSYNGLVQHSLRCFFEWFSCCSSRKSATKQ